VIFVREDHSFGRRVASLSFPGDSQSVWLMDGQVYSKSEQGGAMKAAFIFFLNQWMCRAYCNKVVTNATGEMNPAPSAGFASPLDLVCIQERCIYSGG
jgi:hypothetical protein